MPRGSGTSLRHRTAPALALSLVLLVAGADVPAASGNAPRPASPWGGVARSFGHPYDERNGRPGRRPGRPFPFVPTGGPGRTGRRHGWVLTFSDEFDGASLDTAKWSNGFGWGQDDPQRLRLVRPGQQHRQRRRPRPADRRRGPKGGQPFSVGCIHTKNKFAQQFGYWEARIRAARCYGARTAFWGKPNDESWPPELDVVEVNGDGPDRARRAKFTVHWRAQRAPPPEPGRVRRARLLGGLPRLRRRVDPRRGDLLRRRGRAVAHRRRSRCPRRRRVLLHDPQLAGDRPQTRCAATSRPGRRRTSTGCGSGRRRRSSRARRSGRRRTASRMAAATAGFPVRVQAETPLPPGSGEASGAVASTTFPGPRAGSSATPGTRPASTPSASTATARPRSREVPVTGATNRDWEDLAYARRAGRAGPAVHHRERPERRRPVRLRGARTGARRRPAPRRPAATATPIPTSAAAPTPSRPSWSAAIWPW